MGYEENHMYNIFMTKGLNNYFYTFKELFLIVQAYYKGHDSFADR